MCIKMTIDIHDTVGGPAAPGVTINITTRLQPLYYVNTYILYKFIVLLTC